METSRCKRRASTGPLPPSFTLSATGGKDNTIRFMQNGTSPGAPLSAASALTVVADNIVQGGSLYAPFGTIKLSATEVALASRRQHHVASPPPDLLIPYGRVEIGTDWIYTDGVDAQLKRRAGSSHRAGALQMS